jgi:hypothetical protein
MSRAYLIEWAQRLCAHYPMAGALRNLATLNTSELSALIAFVESHRALEVLAK